MLERLYDRYRATQADIVIFKFQRFNDRSKAAYGPSAGLGMRWVPDSGGPFSASDICPRLFQITTPSPCKLWRRRFVVDHQLSFQNLASSNDLYFTYVGLSLAQNIAVLDEILFLYRTNTSASLTDLRKHHLFCFHDSLMAARATMEEKGVFQQFETSFVNAALSVSLWSLSHVSGDAFGKLYKALRKGIFDELGIVGRDRNYFYNPVFYSELVEIRNSPLWRFKLRKVRKWLYSSRFEGPHRIIVLFGRQTKIPKQLKWEKVPFPHWGRYR